MVAEYKIKIRVLNPNLVPLKKIIASSNTEEYQINFFLENPGRVLTLVPKSSVLRYSM